ncbi:MAG: GSCFA domain-containing protein [Algicola sp.]|nr:GSCFA domain-containing protein [Algicola sp.]
MGSHQLPLAHQLVEVVQTIQDKTYHLLPGAHRTLHHYYENHCQYAALNQASRQSFERGSSCEGISDVEVSDFKQAGQQKLKQAIPSEMCSRIVAQAATAKEAVYHPDFINSILPIILSEAVDTQISGYFGSEYTLAWFTYLESEPQSEADLARWQCDLGPQQQLTMQIYLNSQDEHDGNTHFLDIDTTEQLKQAGYIFSDPELNPQDIGPLCQANGITLNPNSHRAIQAGDALLFNANQIAYASQAPTLAKQHVLQMCFIPSPYHWKFCKNSVLITQTSAIDYVNEAKKLLAYANKKPGETTNLVTIPSDGSIGSPEQMKLWINSIFPNNPFADFMFERLIEADPNLEQLNTTDALLETLRQSFQGSIDWVGGVDSENVYNLSQLAAYEEAFKDSLDRHDQATKPSKTGMYWPSPDHASHPGNKYQSQPYVRKYPIMDADTPIGSAGSCFAQEIAKVFQETGHNYIVTERNDNPHSGMFVDNYQAGDKYAISCANYGIIFNTPSFRQLAERAFGVKATEKMLFQQADGSWIDPYRENVLFMTHEAYVNDYEQHLKATRAALEQSKVFIITLGLNECWQFRDGSVMSRMPRQNIYPLVTHKTLTVQENVDNIQTFFDIVKQHNPELKLIISVSPVPFMATGRSNEYHVIAANTHSKSVLRVAADELVKNNEDMYYLPSYEMVTECIEDPWAEDHRHVKKSTVQRVVQMFREIFIKD